MPDGNAVVSLLMFSCARLLDLPQPPREVTVEARDQRNRGHWQIWECDHSRKCKYMEHRQRKLIDILPELLELGHRYTGGLVAADALAPDPRHGMQKAEIGDQPYPNPPEA